MLEQMFNRAMALHQAGRLTEAEALYRQVISAGVSDPQLQHYYGVVLYQQQKLPEALTAVEAALKRAPGSLDTLMLRGAVLQALNRPSDAMEDFAKVTAAAPRNADAWYNLGVTLGEMDRPQQALEALDRALSIQATPRAWNNRAANLRVLGRPAEALDNVERALAAAPDLVPALYNRALALWDLGRWPDALAALDHMLTRDPKVADAWISRAKVLLALDRLEEARASAERAVALQPDSAAGWLSHGRALSLLGLHERALESLERSLTLDGSSIEARRRRGETLALMRRLEEAVRDFDQVLSVAPEHSSVWHNRGLALHALELYDEALASLDRALALKPDDPSVLLSRAKVLCEAGRVHESFDILARRAQQLFNSPDPAAAAARTPTQAAAKQRHDDEQAAWLAARGVGPKLFHLDGGDRLTGPAVNPANRELVAEQWAASEPKIVVIDRLLTPPALEGLRRFCLGSTVWRKVFRRGYLGAFQEHGFACPLLAQIADELEEVFPSVIDGHGLVNSWGFKYDSQLDGIAIHADQAAVNVNFWITPETANLNPESGGMVIWDKAAPDDWEVTRYNGDDDAVRAFLAESKASSITVPYRENRAVIFDSDLFHETDRIEFREGYENRRINVTMLYGRRNRLNT
jgi:tetratricopeptide (TPR) repeat protein